MSKQIPDVWRPLPSLLAGVGEHGDRDGIRKFRKGDGYTYSHGFEVPPFPLD